MTPHFEITLQGEKKILENSKEFLIFVVWKQIIKKNKLGFYLTRIIL
jgi:hypothetical protein